MTNFTPAEVNVLVNTVLFFMAVITPLAAYITNLFTMPTLTIALALSTVSATIALFIALQHTPIELIRDFYAGSFDAEKWAGVYGSGNAVINVSA